MPFAPYDGQHLFNFSSNVIICFPRYINYLRVKTPLQFKYHSLDQITVLDAVAKL